MTLRITTLPLCHVLFVVMLSVFMLSVVMLIVIMLGVNMLSVVAPEIERGRDEGRKMT